MVLALAHHLSKLVTKGQFPSCTTHKTEKFEPDA